MAQNKFKYINCSTGEMADTPYGADNERRIIYINPKLASKLSPFGRKFWLEHEKGHINLNTDDELEADRYAFNRIVGTEYKSMKHMIEEAEALLDENIPQHHERVNQLYQLAIEYDLKHPQYKSINKANRYDVAQTQAIMQGQNDAFLTLGSILSINQQGINDASSSAANSANLIIILAIAGILVYKLLQK